ncbi:hypothetical protein SBOR_4866 [Sclerotinia borealis F-4128]|uniref:Rhodopsin domain-containing protein n=1 Tax=Sclerotinia borealis (strain F-4128) TaxID=1432307 RepID=W9CJ96_SCLBF|nr:hypothetical protein SBOR_4866 [Sclerotinia borealis F-4128]
MSDPDGPAINPPVGVTPDFDNPGGSHVLGYFIVIFCGIISTLAVLFRLGSRFVLRRINIDDVFLVAGLGFFAGYVYPLYEAAINPGVQVHLWNVRLRETTRLSWLIHIASICYGMSIMFVKLAILMDWLRIFVPMRQRNAMFWAIHVLIWCNVVYYVSGTFLEIFRCWPTRKIWDPFFEGGSCPINIEANNFASTLINLVSDLGILILPQWIIWRLNTTRARRLGAGMARLVYLLQLLYSDDELFYIVDVGLWGIGEITAGFLIIGIPAAPKVVQSITNSSSFTSLISRFRTTAEPTSRPSGDGPSLRTWGRGSSNNRRRGLWEISDNDTFGLVSAQAEAVPSEVELEHLPNQIIKKTQVEIQHKDQSSSD